MKKKYKLPIFILISLVILTTIINPVSSKNTILTDDQIDQEQTEASGKDYIYSDNWKAQSFKPTAAILTRIQLYIAKIGDINTECEIIIKDSLTGQSITNSSVSSSEIPLSNPEWIEFNFIDIALTIDKTYYIIFKTTSGDLSNSYTWFEASNTQYERGTKYFSEDNGQTWEQDPNADFCFKTYGQKAELDIQYLTGGFGWNIYYGIKNSGTFEVDDIEVYISFSGGLLLTGGAYIDSINQTITPGEIYEDNIYPVIGFGPTEITITISSAQAPATSKTTTAFLFFFSIYIRP